MDTTERKLKDLGDAAALYAYEYHKQLAINKDLLEALEALLKLHKRKMAVTTKDYADQLEKAPELARAAIAKARGEEGK